QCEKNGAVNCRSVRETTTGLLMGAAISASPARGSVRRAAGDELQGDELRCGVGSSMPDGLPDKERSHAEKRFQAL
ncbi:MAG TPA: hypothetical protein PKB14_25905, partial [Rubrivivax sp.]|nr:hypothetical protein [Rubrivivax sp.]